jgi:hypothetical protein
MSQGLGTGGIVGIAIAGAALLFFLATRKGSSDTSNDDSNREYDLSNRGGTRRKRARSRRK